MANKKVSQLVSKPSVLVTDLFPIADPTTGQLFKTTISDLGTAIGSGVSSVNGLVGAVVLDTDDIQELASPTNRWFTDTRARAALSASSPLAYNSGTGVFSIPQANGSTNGFLSSADWTTFNNKLSTATAASTYVPYTGATANVNLGLNYSLTAALIIKSGGTSTQFLKADGSIDTNTYLTTGSAASTYLALAGGTLTGALNGTSATFTGDLTLSATNPRLYFTDTDNNPDYFISNTDGTFTVYDVTNSQARFTIGTTGNANFSNAITGGGSITGQSLYSNGIVSVGTYLIMPANNTVGGTNYYIGQQMAGSDYWRIFGNSVSADQGELVFSLGDNGVPIASNGQRFRFYYDASSDGASKDALIIDYNTSTFTTSLVATGATLTGALSGTSATFSSSVTATQGIFQNGTSGTTISATNTGGGSVSLGISSNATSVATLAFTNSLSLTGGNVGIGTTSPLNATGYTSISLNNATNGGILDYQQNGTSVMRVGNNGTTVAFIETRTATPLTISTNDTERMRITSSGHIQTNGNPVYAYSGSISIGGTYQTIFAAVSGGVYLVSVTTDSADGTFGLLTVVNDPDKSLGMIYGNNISLQFSGDNVQMKSTNGSTYNTTWTATRLK